MNRSHLTSGGTSLFILLLALIFAAEPAAAEGTTTVDRVRAEQAPIVKLLPTPAAHEIVSQPDMRTRLQCRKGVCVSVSEKTALPKPAAIEGAGAKSAARVSPARLQVVPPSVPTKRPEAD